MKPKHVVAIIQGRMSSSRLPGKILKDLNGKPILAWVVERARRAQTIDEVVVATTDDASDDPAANFCKERGYAFFRGSMFDVLDRYFQTALAYHADIIVRLTADCPLIDPQVVDKTVRALLDSNPPADLAVNRFPGNRTYPIGLDTEVVTFQALERAWKEAGEPHEREHVLPYIYEVEGRFRVLHVKNDVDYGGLRWTVDTPEDFELVQRICNHFPGRDDFSWLDVLAVVQADPTLSQINANVHHKGFLDVDERSQKVLK
jgi:spore coat polysaccharide biosynthesis protein SpsF